jgi:hypothetical protein
MDVDLARKVWTAWIEYLIAVPDDEPEPLGHDRFRELPYSWDGLSPRAREQFREVLDGPIGDAVTYQVGVVLRASHADLGVKWPFGNPRVGNG